MAKNWTIEAMDMTRTYKDEVPMLVINLELLFPEIEDMDEAQQGTISNGVKQKLDDSIARSKEEKLTEVEKREVQSALWDRLKDDRKWNMEKTGGVRGPSVSLKTLIPALNAAGMTAEQMAAIVSKPLEVIEKFLKTGIEEETEE